MISRLRSISILCLGITVAAFARPAFAAEPPVRVMSFNIRYGTAKDGENHWDKRKDFLVDVIRKFDPDLLGTQETLAFQRDYILEKLPEYAAFGVGRDNGTDKGEMAALFYKKDRFEKLDGGNFWLSETPEKVGSKGWDTSLPRLSSWVVLRDKKHPGGPEIFFCNTHFDHMGKEARLNSAKLTRKVLLEKGKQRAIIQTGDFNAGEGSAPFQALFAQQGEEDSPVVDAYRVAHPERKKDEGTANAFDPARVEGARIDWIGLSRDWTIDSIEIDRTIKEGKVPSDHFPVKAVIHLKAKTE